MKWLPASAIPVSTIIILIFCCTSATANMPVASASVTSASVTDTPQKHTFQKLLDQFFQQRLAAIADQVTVTIKTPAEQWHICETPLLSLPGVKSWGALSVTVVCPQAKRFIRVEVQATGQYLVASRAIARGEALTQQNVQIQRGLLNSLPPRTALSFSQLHDAVSLRNLSPGQPVQLSLVRQAWRVRSGQQVQVIIQGEGFSASSSGQALNNAAVAQSVRVRMPSGQIIHGVVNTAGIVQIAE